MLSTSKKGKCVSPDFRAEIFSIMYLDGIFQSSAQQQTALRCNEMRKWHRKDFFSKKSHWDDIEYPIGTFEPIVPPVQDLIFTERKKKKKEHLTSVSSKQTLHCVPLQHWHHQIIWGKHSCNMTKMIYIFSTGLQITTFFFLHTRFTMYHKLHINYISHLYPTPRPVTIYSCILTFTASNKMNYSEDQTRTGTSEPFQKLHCGENTEPSVPFSEIFRTGEFIIGLNVNGG